MKATYAATGVSQPGRREAIIAHAKIGGTVLLLPEPSNPFDPNAVMFMLIAADGTEHHIGYLPKPLTTKVEPLPAFGVKATIVKVLEHNGQPVNIDVEADLPTHGTVRSSIGETE
jgi:hypothetical protein